MGIELSDLDSILDNAEVLDSNVISLRSVKSEEVCTNHWLDLYKKTRKTGTDYCSSGLTRITGGCLRGSLTVWAAHTGHGKTTIMMQELISACRRGEKVLFYPLEMTEQQVLERLIVMMTGVPIKMIREPSMEWLDLVNSGWAELESFKLDIQFGSSYTPLDVCNRVKHRRPDKLIVDYLQRHSFSDYRQFAEIIKLYKNVALETDTIIHIGSQINPPVVTKGANPLPIVTVNELFGGKTISFEADYVIQLYVDAENVGEGHWRKLDTGRFVVLKNRNGEQGLTSPIKFSKTLLSWVDDE